MAFIDKIDYKIEAITDVIILYIIKYVPKWAIIEMHLMEITKGSGIYR